MHIYNQRIWTRLVFIIVSILFFSQMVQAQRMRITVEERVKILKDSLKLSNEQVTKITELFEDQREEITELRSKHQGERETMQNAIQDLMKKTNERVKAILTEEQAKEYDQLMKERRQRLGRRMKGM